MPEEPIIEEENKGTGALIDPRGKEERIKDFKFEELVAGADPVKWVEKEQKDWRSFPIFDQNGSGSCVAQTLAKLLGILYWLENGVYVHFSATHIYQQRANKPSSGMAGDNAFQIARNGVTLEVLSPSQEMTDKEMDSAVIEDYKKRVGEVFKLPNYVSLPTKNIDTIASTIQKTGKGVMVWFYFSSGLPKKEWTNVPEINYSDLPLSGNNTARHSVTAVDFTLYKGKKALIIEDSWGTDAGYTGRRIVTEDFFRERNWYAAYPINFAFIEGVISKPKYTFTSVLEFSETYKVVEDVKRLQDILKYEGLFPSNVESTGYYGAVTAKAVLDFQKKYAVAPVSELNSLAGRRVGSKTISKLNELYS